jgi:hypothetical protein
LPHWVVRATEEDNTYEGDGSNIGGWDRYLARERKISVMYAPRYAPIILCNCAGGMHRARRRNELNGDGYCFADRSLAESGSLRGPLASE